MNVRIAVQRAVVGLLLLVLPAACASQGTAMWPSASPQLEKVWSPGDLDLVRQAMMANTVEVRMADLAQQQAKRDSVRALGRLIVQDHIAAGGELAPIVRGAPVNMPESADPEHVAALDRLAGLRGEAFDAAFLQQMTDDHTKGIALFERIAGTASDRDLRAWAERHLPAMRAHLASGETALARATRGKVNPSASPKTR